MKDKKYQYYNTGWLMWEICYIKKKKLIYVTKLILLMFKQNYQLKANDVQIVDNILHNSINSRIQFFFTIKYLYTLYY